jgi:uncharacterized protein YjbI with pentapeptide repeats
MSNPEHLAKLKEGVEAWNEWRNSNPSIKSDLSEADLSDAKLIGADFHEANLISANLISASLRKVDLQKAQLQDASLQGADLSGANLGYANLLDANLLEANLDHACLVAACVARANLSRANLVEANFTHADLRGANLSGANLDEANLDHACLVAAYLQKANLRGASVAGANLVKSIVRGANLADTNFVEADLSEANLSEAVLVRTNLERSVLTACSVYGISVWDVRLDGSIQSNLVITPPHDSVIQVDNLEVAQFVYLLLNNAKIRHVIDTITSKVVLILGRFTPERKVVLDAIREELRKHDYLPVLFDFEKPSSQTTVETVSTLAHMARFVIADLTDAKSILQELQAIVPDSPSVVVRPLLLASQEEPGMFDFIRRYPWVLDTHRYTDQKMLLEELGEVVIAAAEAKAKELRQKSEALNKSSARL